MPSQAELALLLTAQDNISKVLKSARGEVQQMGEAVQKSGRHVDEFNLRTRNYSSGLGNLGFIATGATAAIIGLGAAAIGAGVKSIMLAANMEQSKIAFTTMLGSAEKADTFIKELFDFAAHTPFEFVGLQESSKRLLAYGFTAEQIIPTLTAVGNAAAGLGASQETIGRITLALGQMQAKGKVSGEEMRQLAEVGIPAWELLAKAIGKDIPEAMKLAEKGAIPAAGAVQALIQGMSQKFPDMMEKQSHTLVGVWSTAKDDMTQILTRLGEAFSSALDIKGKVLAADAALKDLEPTINWLILKAGEVGSAWDQSVSIIGHAVEEAKKRVAEAARNPVVEAFGAGLGAWGGINQRVTGSLVPTVLTPDMQKRLEAFQQQEAATRASQSYTQSLFAQSKAAAAAAAAQEKEDQAVRDSIPAVISLGGAAEKAKTALEALGISAGTMREAMTLLKFSTDQQAAVLMALGVEAIDAGPLLEGLGITAEKLAAAFNRAGLAGGELSAQVQGIIAQRQAEAEADKAAAKAKEELAAAEERAKKAREAAVGRTVGTATQNILGVQLGVQPGSAGEAQKQLEAAVSGLQDMAVAHMDLTIPLAAVNKSLGDLQGLFTNLSGADLGSAGAVMDAMMALTGQLLSGEIQIEDYQAGMGKLSGKLGELASASDAAAQKQKDLAAAELAAAQAAAVEEAARVTAGWDQRRQQGDDLLEMSLNQQRRAKANRELAAGEELKLAGELAQQKILIRENELKAIQAAEERDRVQREQAARAHDLAITRTNLLSRLTGGGGVRGDYGPGYEWERMQEAEGRLTAIAASGGGGAGGLNATQITSVVEAIMANLTLQMDGEKVGAVTGGQQQSRGTLIARMGGGARL